MFGNHPRSNLQDDLGDVRVELDTISWKSLRNPVEISGFSSMDSNFWTSRLAAAKRQYALQQHRNSHHLDRFGLDDFEVEDEVQSDYSCPYCYEDFDIASLCSHLEDEHSCDQRTTRWRRLRRVGAVPSSQAMSFLGRNLREAHLQTLLGTSGYRPTNSNVSTNSAAANDPLLSSLILNFPASEAEEISKSIVTSTEDAPTEVSKPTQIWKSSFDPSMSVEEREKRIRQDTGRAGFLQDVLFSTLVSD